MKNEGGTKFDGNKPPLALIPPEAVGEEALVWKHGAQKYGLHNFRKGISYLRLLSAALRHIFAIIEGEDNDPETGLPHWAHARCCLGMLAVMMKTRPDLDDRFPAALKSKKKG